MKHSLLSDTWYFAAIVLIAAGLILIGLGVAHWIAA